MITIQISSDPYKRKITYDIVEGEQLISIESSNPNKPTKSLFDSPYLHISSGFKQKILLKRSSCPLQDLYF